MQQSPRSFFFFFFTNHTLSVTVLAGHRQIQPEELAVADVDVAGLGATESIDPTVEGFVRLHLHGDPRVLAVDDNWKNRTFVIDR